MTNAKVPTTEERLQAVEDQLAIYQVITAYGYSVDGLNTDSVRDCYSEEGVYAVADIAAFQGRDQIANITKDPGHQGLVAAGCAHISTLPFVVIDGDEAVATCHTMVATHKESDFSIWRLSASRIQLARQQDGHWKIVHRQNYLLDGNPEAISLLSRLNEGPRKA